MQLSFFRRCITCKEQKLLTEFPTQPTEHGGRSYQCKKCHAVAVKKWREQNKDKYKEQKKRDREKHKERYASYLKEWRMSNKDRFRAYLNNRKSKHKNGYVSPDEWLAILEKYDGKCIYCERSGNLTQDHWIPLARGGKHTASNIVPACQSCNRHKYTRTGEEYFALLGKPVRRL